MLDREGAQFRRRGWGKETGLTAAAGVAPDVLRGVIDNQRRGGLEAG